MKIVIIGAGKIGSYIARELCQEGHDIAVVDVLPKRLQTLSGSLDVICVEGSGVDLGLLQQAGTAQADMFIAATGSDERNLLCCLAARRLGARHTIARLREATYLDQDALLLEDIGLYQAISPDREAAAEIARILEFPSADRVETFAQGRAELVEDRISQGSPLDGLALKDLQGHFGAKVLLCAVERGQEVLIPKGNFILRSGDTIHVLGSRKELRSFFKALGTYKKAVRHVFILGGSTIAVLLVRQLARAGISATLVEQNEDRAEQLCTLLPKTRIVLADGTRPEVLREEGLLQTDAFVALTGSDEQNIITSMYAQSCGVGKIITKVNEEGLTAMLESSGLDCFISPKELTAQRMLASARALFQSGPGSVETLYRLVDQRIEALEFAVADGSRCAGKPLKDLRVRQEVLVAAVLRQNELQIAGGGTVLQPGDRAVIITAQSGLASLDEILEA